MLLRVLSFAMQKVDKILDPKTEIIAKITLPVKATKVTRYDKRHILK